MYRLLLAAILIAVAGRALAAEIVDIAGRSVEIDGPVERIVVGDGRILTAIALLDREDPLRRVEALLSDLAVTDPDLLEALRRRYAKASSMPILAGDAASVSAETIISLDPDAAVFGLQDHGPGTRNKELLDQLEAVGIAVVFVDFRQDPLNNTMPSLRILGALLDRAAEADEFAGFYQARKDAIAERVAGLREPRPKVFLQAHVGRMPCCVGMANGMLGPFIDFAGGENISARVAPGVVGRHTLEFLIAEDPDVWIGTASGHPRDFEQGNPVIVLGAGVDPEMAAQSLAIALEAAELDHLSAVRTGRAYGIWHNFYNSLFNIYALESFAKWIQPELFDDLDPEATLAEIYERFLPFELEGTYAARLPR